MLYIVGTAKNPYRNIENTMPFVGKGDIDDTCVHYSDKTFAEYNAEHGGTLVALTWDELYDQYEKPKLICMQGEFKECTEEQFEDAFECLPPKRYTRRENSEDFFFFIGECTTGTLYGCFVKKDGKYYSALRSIHTSAEDIFEMKKVG